MSILLKDFLNKTRDEFLADHPHALVIVDNPGQDVENTSFQTIAREADESQEEQALLERLGRWVFVLRRRNRFASMVTVGRASNSDMRLSVPSVSKFHAYFTYVARDRCWFLADANSSNGTFIQGKELPPAHGKVRLNNGCVLRFGPDVTAQFYDAAGVWEMLQERTEESRPPGGDEAKESS